jgi:hypothetical protein
MWRVCGLVYLFTSDFRGFDKNQQKYRKSTVFVLALVLSLLLLLLVVVVVVAVAVALWRGPLVALAHHEQLQLQPPHPTVCAVG